MKQTTFVIGGCRSGKSGHALRLAETRESSRKIYIATCVPRDDEMRKRVQKHQAERDRNWTLIESPIKIWDPILNHSEPDRVILLDCLTLWINNLMLEQQVEEIEDMAPFMNRLVRALKQADGQVILVANEVGTGIVPENRLARKFRDIAGFVNQEIAACSGQVVWVVAGIPVTIKGS